MERSKPVASSSCSGAAVEARPSKGHSGKLGNAGNALGGSSLLRLAFSGASRCGTPTARSKSRGWQPSPALIESVLVGVPMGGAITLCAYTPHIGTAVTAAASETQAIANTNAVSVHRRTNHSC